MKIAILIIIAAILAALSTLGGFLLSPYVFSTFVENRTFSNMSGLFWSQLPFIAMRFTIGIVGGAILAIVTHRRSPLLWAALMSVAATIGTIALSTRIYFITPSLLERIIHGADLYMFVPGALVGSFLVSQLLRLTTGSTGRQLTSGPAKPGELSGGAG